MIVRVACTRKEKEREKKEKHVKGTRRLSSRAAGNKHSLFPGQTMQ